MSVQALPQLLRSKTTLAYIAGIIDADGTIGIKRSTYAMRVTKDCSQPTYSERICVKQVEPQAVDLLSSVFGGYRFECRGSSKNGRVLQGWQVTDKKAAAALRAILPFLRIKKQQAENCLQLRRTKEASKKARVARGRGHAGSSNRTKAHSDEMLALYENAHRLNKVGS